MAFVQKKNSPLADRRFARFEANLQRERGLVGRFLLRTIATAGAVGAAVLNPMMEGAMRAFERRFRRRYGLASSLFKPNGERECARRRRQIASGQLTSANGLVREGRQ